MSRPLQAKERWADPAYRARVTASIRQARRSKMWTRISPEAFREIVRKAATLSDIASAVGLASTNHRAVLARIEFENLDISHIPRGRHHNRGRKFPSHEVPLAEVMVEHSAYTAKHLKRRLISEGILKEECALCRQEPSWRGQPLVLILDHKNGVNDDARLENLRLVCPNCGSQLPTFAGRNVKRSAKAGA